MYLIFLTKKKCPKGQKLYKEFGNICGPTPPNCGLGGSPITNPKSGYVVCTCSDNYTYLVGNNPLYKGTPAPVVDHGYVKKFYDSAPYSDDLVVCTEQV